MLNNLTAYRKDQNCETSFIGWVERWKQAVDKRIVVGVLSTDMSKAFYSLYPPLLINKLRAYGFSNNVLTLMGSYFTNKKQSLDQSRNNKRWVRDHERLSPGIGLRVPSLERLSKQPTPLHRMKIGYCLYHFCLCLSLMIIYFVMIILSFLYCFFLQFPSLLL